MKISNDEIHVRLGGLSSEVKTLEPLYRTINDPQEAPIDALGDVLGPAAKALALGVGAPQSLCFQSVLSVANLVAQSLRNVDVDGRVHPISEFFISEAISGDRKSEADKWALKAVTAWEKRKLEQYGVDIADFQIAEEAYKRSRAQCKSSPTARLTTEEISNALKSMGDPPKRPRSPYIIVEEGTVEGLIKLLEHNLPSIGIFSAEGGQMIGGHAMNRDNLLKSISVLSNFWDGKPISRVRAEERIKMFGRRLCMHLLLQPTVGNVLWTNEIAAGQGFFARCLRVRAKSLMGTRGYVNCNLQEDPCLQKFWSTVDELLNHPLSMDSGYNPGLNLSSLHLSPEAKKRYVAFYTSVEDELKEGGKYRPISAFASKAAEHSVRIAATLTCISSQYLLEIDELQMDSGARIMDFYLNEALRLSEVAQVSQDLQDAQVLYHWIVNEGMPEVYLVKIYQCGPRGIREKSRAKKLMRILEDHGHLIPVGTRKIDGQMRREAWVVNVEK